MITSTIVGLMFLGLLGIALILVFLFFREIKNQPQKLSLPQKVSMNTPTNANPVSHQETKKQPQKVSSPKKVSMNTSASTRVVSYKLQKRLHNLLNGDTKAATRLLKHLQQKHPNYPEEWYWEKAILDLERDRH